MRAHMKEAYADRPATVPLPESERARDGCMLLYPQMIGDEQAQVVAALRAALASDRRVRPTRREEPLTHVLYG